MKILLMVILLAFNQNTNVNNPNIENEKGETTQWFILLDGEIVYVIDAAKDLDVGLSHNYISFHGDFIFNSGFEHENKILKKIRKKR